MSRTMFLTASLAIMQWAGAATFRQETLVHFEKDRSTLTTEAIALLDALLADIELTGDHGFALHGHTDSDGSHNYNNALALSRARAVQEHLVQRGVDPEVITVGHSGKRAPVAPNDDAGSLAMNRRVSVVYERHHWQDLSELRNALSEGSTFRSTIDPCRDEVLIAPGGTVLRFGANTLVDAQGRPAAGPVHVEVTEALDLTSFMAHDLSTRSGERLLETGGMVRIDATDAEGNLLALRNGSTLEVNVPTTAPMDGMELFLSDADGSDWAPARTQVVVSDWSTFGNMPQAPRARRFRVGSLNIPPYQPDLANKPRRPMTPAPPRMPTPPRLGEYTPHVPWWRFWERKQREETVTRYQAHALERFEKQYVRCERRLEQYEKDVETYPARLASFEERLTAWEQEEVEAHARWCLEVRDKALRDHERLLREVAKRQGEVNGIDSVALNAWRIQRDSIMESMRVARDAQLQQWRENVENGGMADMNGMQAFVFNTGNLGWINVDRFYDVPAAQTRQVLVYDGGPAEKQVALIFSDMCSLLQLKSAGNGQYTQRIPKQASVKLLAYAVEDGRPMVCMLDVPPEGKLRLAFRPSSLKEIARLLSGLEEAV